MKKLELKGKLNLNKETITKLNNVELNNIKGGLNNVPSMRSVCGPCTETRPSQTLMSVCC